MFPLFCPTGVKYNYIYLVRGFPGGSVVKNLPALQEPQEMWVQSLGQEDPLEEGMAKPSPVFLPRESHGQRKLAGYISLSCNCLELQRAGDD